MRGGGISYMWESFLVAFNAVMPFLIYLLLGFGLVRAGWTDRPFLDRLNRLTFRAFFPVLMFQNIYGITPDRMPSLRLLIMAAVSLTALVAVLMAAVPRIVKENPRRGVIVQGIFRSNFLLYGIGLATFVYGSEVSAVASILVMVVVSLFNIYAVIVLETFRGQGRSSLGQLILKLLKNPLLQGCLLGIAAFLFRVRLPVFLEKPVSAIASMSTPLAMITLGGTLRFDALRKNRRPLSIVMVLKLVVIPMVMMSIAYLIGLRGVELFLILMVYGTPVATSSYPMAVNMDGDGELAGQLVFVSTVLSLGTVFAFIFAMSRLGLLGI